MLHKLPYTRSFLVHLLRVLCTCCKLLLGLVVVEVDIVSCNNVEVVLDTTCNVHGTMLGQPVCRDVTQRLFTITHSATLCDISP